MRVRLRRWSSLSRRSRVVALGVVGALLHLGGIGVHLAMTGPPFMQDESSHVGYAQTVRSGGLPTVTTPVPLRGGGEELEIALSRPWPFSDPEIHVANNPPFVYAAALPLMELSDRADLRGGSNFGLRMANVLGAVGAVGFAFLLGRELAGGDAVAGLATAGMLTGTISVPVIMATANVDGPALMATTGATWALARLARTRRPEHALHLGLFCAAGAAVRPMALAFVAAAGLLGLLVCVRERGARALVPDGLRIGLPAVVLTGWFYALNVHRYGDPTGSAALFEKYGTPDGPPLPSVLTSGESLVQPLHYLVVEVYGQVPWWLDTAFDKWAVTIAAVGFVAAAVVMSFRSRQGGDDGSAEPGAAHPRRTLVPDQWVAMAVLLPAPVLVISQHISGGGAGHPRYLIPMLPIIAAAVALVLTRIRPLLALVPVVIVAVAGFARVDAAGDLFVNAFQSPGMPLGTPVGGRLYRDLALASAFAGAACLVVCTALVAVREVRAQPVAAGRSDPT